MNVISGMMAADGEACKTMNTGRPNHSALGERPMTMPASTPPRPVSSTPTTSGRIVSLYASRNVPSASMSPKAAIVWLKLGNAGLIATRPAHSQRARTRRTERTRRVRGSVTALTTRTGTLPNERRFAGRYGLVLRRRWGGRPQGGARQLPRVAGDQATSPGPRRANARGGGVLAAAQRGVPAARGARGVPFGRDRERLPGRLEGRRLRQGGREQPRRSDGDRLQPRVRGVGGEPRTSGLDARVQPAPRHGRLAKVLRLRRAHRDDGCSQPPAGTRRAPRLPRVSPRSRPAAVHPGGHRPPGRRRRALDGPRGCHGLLPVRRRVP